MSALEDNLVMLERVSTILYLITEILESHEVLGLTQPVQPSTTKGQCAKVLIDHIQQVLGLGQPVGKKICRSCCTLLTHT